MTIDISYRSFLVYLKILTAPRSAPPCSDQSSATFYDAGDPLEFEIITAEKDGQELDSVDFDFLYDDPKFIDKIMEQL